MDRRASLASRLAVTIGGAVALVIVAAGLVITAGVIGRFDAYLEAAHMERYTQAAAAAAALAKERGTLQLRIFELRGLAVAAGGPLEIRDSSGAVVAQIDSLPGVGPAPAGGQVAPGAPIEVPLLVDGTVVGSLVVRSRAPRRCRRRPRRRSASRRP
jgi:hypothetical protein